MIMGLDMNNVMDNNWVLFCNGMSSCPFCGSVLTATSMHTKPHLLFVAQFSHSYFHAYQTTPTFCGSVLTATSIHTKPHLLNARARGLHCVYVSLVIM